MKKITFLLVFFQAFSFLGYAQFSESFENGIPPTWTVINGIDANTWEVGQPLFSPAHTGNNVARIRFSSDPHDDYLITEQFNVIAGTSDRLTLWARNLSFEFVSENFDILLSTTGNQPSDFTSTIASSIVPTDQFWEKLTYSLEGYVGQTVFIAFHSHTTNRNQLYLDDITVDTEPTTPPGCITNPVSVTNPNCGNFSTLLSWDTVPNIDGYYLSIGTTSGGTEILNNQDLGLSTNYVVENQLANSTYYWKVVPYNTIGTASGCVVNEYTTAASTCYCAPNPQSVADFGITHVSIGTINNQTLTEAGNYGDYSSQITDVYQGLSMPFSITFQTSGFDYETKIWVDWNNDYDFDDAGEEVYSGVSESDMPTTLIGSFLVPSTATLGNYRMRIGGQDNGPVLPCYNGSYGSFEDYTINVIAANCTPAYATTSIITDCATSQYFVELNVTDLGNGTPYVSDGIDAWPVVSVGSMQVGPYPFGTQSVLTLHNGVDAVCDMPLGAFNFLGCAPTNDQCANAIALIPGGTYEDHIQDGTNISATDSAETTPTCFGYNGGDVWYSVIVPDSGNLTIETGHTSTGDAPYFDSVIAIYSGECGSLVQIDCDDDSADTDNYSLKSLTGLTPGSKLYINVFEYFNDHSASFGISAYDVSLSTASFDDKKLSIYPNPVKDVLNLSYTSVISSVSIHNVLGQEVLNKNINATDAQINMSSLDNGTYLVKVMMDDVVKTVKVIKAN